MMSKLFNDLEGLKIAIEIEKRGHAFYQQAYSQAQKEEHKELFLLLRDEETHHLAKFTSICEKVQKDESNADFDEETSKYLSVLAANHVFPREEEAAKRIHELSTMDAILATAMQAEKDSILFYDELATKASCSDARKVFAALKAEEQQHVIKLREMMDAWA